MVIRRITRCSDAPPATGQPEPEPNPPPVPRRRIRAVSAAPEHGLRAFPHLPPEAEQEDEEYRVGKGKPPLHTRFVKGQSGNPKGRPGGARGLKTMIRDTLTARVKVRSEGGTRRMSKIEAIIHKLMELAAKGDQRAAIHLMTLYAAAVPDQPDQGPEGPAALTETDEAIIARFRAEILSNVGEVQ